jgi:hypothetical protein
MTPISVQPYMRTGGSAGWGFSRAASTAAKSRSGALNQPDSTEAGSARCAPYIVTNGHTPHFRISLHNSPDSPSTSDEFSRGVAVTPGPLTW